MELKEQCSAVDVTSGFVLATTMTPASVHDSNYLPYLTVASCHNTGTYQERCMRIRDITGAENRSFLHLNEIEEGVIMGRYERDEDNEGERSRGTTK